MLLAILWGHICAHCGNLYTVERCNCGCGQLKNGHSGEAGLPAIICASCKVGMTTWVCPDCRMLNTMGKSLVELHHS